MTTPERPRLPGHARLASWRRASPRRPPVDPALLGRTLWMTGWRRTAFNAIWLVYLAATAGGISAHASGARAVAGYTVLAAFCAGYLYAFPSPTGYTRRGFHLVYGLMWAAYVVEIPIARSSSGAMATYLVVIGVVTFGRPFLPVAGALAVLTLVLPTLIPSWHASVDTGSALAIATVALAMYALFRILRANAELTQARAEVGRLAAENERNRIARDLHDLLGHSLTTITVKAGLARRLAATDPAGSIREITEVEELGRRSLAEVRATVSGYREATLAGELSSARELLRAAGIGAELPPAVEAVDPAADGLFAWVLREGLTNVVRHSHATRCSVTLGPRRLEIVDDGGGGAGLGSGRGGGNGLRGVAERVAAAGGRFEAGPAGADGRGWRLVVELPAGAGPAGPAGAGLAGPAGVDEAAGGCDGAPVDAAVRPA